MQIINILDLYIDNKISEANSALEEHIMTIIERPNELVHKLLLDLKRKDLKFKFFPCPVTQVDAQKLMLSLESDADKYFCALYVMKLQNKAASNFVDIVLERIGAR